MVDITELVLSHMMLERSAYRAGRRSLTPRGSEVVESNYEPEEDHDCDRMWGQGCAGCDKAREQMANE